MILPPFFLNGVYSIRNSSVGIASSSPALERVIFPSEYYSSTQINKLLACKSSGDNPANLFTSGGSFTVISSLIIEPTLNYT
jgi:hypothetical protein